MHSQCSPGGSHRKQQIALVSQQGEESLQIRTDTYHHDSLAFSVQTGDTEDRKARRDRITACLLMVEEKISDVPKTNVQNDSKGRKV